MFSNLLMADGETVRKNAKMELSGDGERATFHLQRKAAMNAPEIILAVNFAIYFLAVCQFIKYLVSNIPNRLVLKLLKNKKYL